LRLWSITKFGKILVMLKKSSSSPRAVSVIAFFAPQNN
jgi:hypothetical protein